MSDLKRIIIVGSGLAANMTAAALALNLGDAAQITLIGSEEAPASDLFYGSVTAPNAYNFLVGLGISEPRLMLQSETAFSLGTHYADWPCKSGGWVQSHHLPLPVLEGVPFHHYLTKRREALEPYLVSSSAAARGVFAHPPEDARLPLSRAEYGFLFSPNSLAGMIAASSASRSVQRVTGEVAAMEHHNHQITSIKLTDGTELIGDLFVDCTGADRQLISKLGSQFEGARRLKAVLSRGTISQLGAAVRTITAYDFGWQSNTPLQGAVDRLTVFDPSEEAAAISAHSATPAQTCDIELGQLASAWIGNCVAIGHAAALDEPLTPAPMMLLQRDIERLLDLIPVSEDMYMESKEYNRRFNDDVSNARLFQRTLFETGLLPQTSYWQNAISAPASEKLTRKLTQFESRGIHVLYDLEPFNQEDWSILHYGMGRMPRRYDRQVDKVAPEQVERQLAGLKQSIASMTAKMPPHHVYMNGLKKYLEKQNHA